MLGVSDVRSIPDLDDLDIAFSNGIKGLNEENRETLKNIMKGLLLKQHLEEQNNTDEDKWFIWDFGWRGNLLYQS